MASSTDIARLRSLARHRLIRRFITLVAVVASAFLQAYTIRAFMEPADIISSGFTGIAMLIERLTGLTGFTIPTSVGMVALNIPVALLAWRSISRRFVLFSALQVVLSSLFLRFIHVDPPLDNVMLETIFGGFLTGLAIAIALKSGASTAGTDFISLMVSNKTGKTIWGYVFAGNCLVLCIFGSIFGWEHAAFSIILQFISTKTIEGFYHRYDRVTLIVTTQHADEVMDAYTKAYRHGLSCVDALGGYSREPYQLLHIVISAYEADDTVRLIKFVDPKAVINVLRTDAFYGNFHMGAVDEPVPAEVPDPGKEPPVDRVQVLAGTVGMKKTKSRVK